jgi:hypothetical protein
MSRSPFFTIGADDIIATAGQKALENKEMLALLRQQFADFVVDINRAMVDEVDREYFSQFKDVVVGSIAEIDSVLDFLVVNPLCFWLVPENINSVDVVTALVRLEYNLRVNIAATKQGLNSGIHGIDDRMTIDGHRVIDDMNDLLSGLLDLASIVFENLSSLIKFALKHIKTIKKSYPENRVFGLKVRVRLNSDLLTISTVRM